MAVKAKKLRIRLTGALQRIAQHRRLRVIGEIVVLFVGELSRDRGLDPVLVQHPLESGRGLSALGRVRLIDDDGKALPRRVDLHAGALLLKGRERSAR